LSLRYKLGDGEGIMSIIVNPQTAPIQGDAAVDKMALLIGKQLRQAAINENAKILSPARVIPDGRFLLKVHDRTRGSMGRCATRSRSTARWASSCSTSRPSRWPTTTTTPRPIHAAGEQARGRGAHRHVGPNRHYSPRAREAHDSARLDRTAQGRPQRRRRDLHQPRQAWRRLVVRSRIIPKNETTNKEVRRNARGHGRDDYRNDAIPAGATPPATSNLTDNAGLAKSVARELDWNGGRGRRRSAAGRSVTSPLALKALIPPGDDDVARQAQEMAESLRSLDDKRRLRNRRCRRRRSTWHHVARRRRRRRRIRQNRLHPHAGHTCTPGDEPAISGSPHTGQRLRRADAARAAPAPRSTRPAGSPRAAAGNQYGNSSSSTAADAPATLDHLHAQHAERDGRADESYLSVVREQAMHDDAARA
jgi:hypothetical protein